MPAPTVSPQTRPGRIAAFDMMRGLFLLVILINHLHRFPGIYDFFTGHADLWGSVAEGFFLISGLLIGLIRRPALERGELRSVGVKLIRRAGMLYAVSVSLTIFFTLVGRWLFLDNVGLKPGIFLGGFGTLLSKTLLLQYGYGWADFLLYFSVYLLLSPAVLWLLRARQVWFVVALSITAFAYRGHNGYLIWQLYFFTGMAVGYHFYQLGGSAAGLSRRCRRWLTGALLGLAGLTLALSFAARVTNPSLAKHGSLGISQLAQLQRLGAVIDTRTHSFFDRWDSYGWGRPAIIFLWFWALYYLFTRYENALKRQAGWLLMPLGKNSFAAYIIESFVVFACSLVLVGHDDLASNFLLSTAAIASTWITVMLFDRSKRRLPKRG